MPSIFTSIKFFNRPIRAVAAYLKVVRRMNTSSGDGIREGEHERETPPLVRGVGVSPKKILNF